MLSNSLFDTVFFVVTPLCMIDFSQNKVQYSTVIRNTIFKWHKKYKSDQ